jgi:uncharacterized protein (TIGR00369 family)
VSRDTERPEVALPDGMESLIEQAIVVSPYGRVLGLELVEALEDCVRVRLPYRPELVTYGDTLHGGVLSGLVDVAATASFWASPAVKPGAQGATIGFSINFVAAARGKDVVATARVRRRGREISTGEVAVHDADGREVAVALVTYKLSPPPGDA